MHDTGSEAAPDWDALVAPIARTQPWRGDAERAEGSQPQPPLSLPKNGTPRSSGVASNSGSSASGPGRLRSSAAARGNCASISLAITPAERQSAGSCKGKPIPRQVCDAQPETPKDERAAVRLSGRDRHDAAGRYE
jgi:hypothetical protein